MTTPKQPKDVDSSQQDTIDFIDNPENVKKAIEGSMDKRLKVMDSSLREQIEIVLDAVANGTAAESTLVMDNMVDAIMSLVASYADTAVANFIASEDYHGLIEAAAIDARLAEIDLLPPMFAPYKSTRYAELQAQKAVLEDK